VPVGLFLRVLKWFSQVKFSINFSFSLCRTLLRIFFAKISQFLFDIIIIFFSDFKEGL